MWLPISYYLFLSTEPITFWYIFTKVLTNINIYLRFKESRPLFIFTITSATERQFLYFFHCNNQIWNLLDSIRRKARVSKVDSLQMATDREKLLPRLGNRQFSRQRLFVEVAGQIEMCQVLNTSSTQSREQLSATDNDRIHYHEMKKWNEGLRLKWRYHRRTVAGALYNLGSGSWLALTVVSWRKLVAAHSPR